MGCDLDTLLQEIDAFLYEIRAATDQEDTVE